ncbi:MAG: thioredoxin family protein [Sulfurimonas sp.]|uniref:thioredoxin family protein n=1 Tax=Sulfurimonas sp. TaxID=2022749 RepID=UPI0028CF757B|nr:thioredoxin family protein [Sulfurimonas sp.]MDT8337798.1 thioredoxin family protein [Sulfurimonas sp.]
MRYLLLVMALLFNLNAFDWPSDYENALLEAKKEKKDIYLFIGSEYCRYCEKFEKEVLSQDEVIEKLKKSYVLIYLSRDIDDIPSHLETTPVPRHYFLTKEGKVIYTTIGGRSTEGFYELLDEVEEAKEL